MALTINQVDAIYQALYGRNPTTTELLTASQIDTAFGDQAVVTTLVNSSETSTYDFDVYTIIVAATGVQPTAAQISGWVTFLELNAPAATPGSPALVAALAQMVNAFANSTQFQNTYGLSPTVSIGSLTNAQATTFMTKLYQNTQNVTPTTAQINAWIATKVTIGQIFAQFATNTASINAQMSSMVTFFTNLADTAAGLAINQPTIVTLMATPTNITNPGPLAINGTYDGATATFIVGDNITPTGTGNTLSLVDLGAASGYDPTNIAGITVSGVQTLTILSGLAVNANTASSIEGFSGLTQMTVTESSAATASSITAASTTGITVTDASQTTAALAVQGGLNVSVTTKGETASTATITVGTTSAPVGTVTIVASSSANATSFTMGAITETGGTAVNITENELGAVNNTIAGGAITVTGTAGTTSVTVNQTAAVNASATVTGVADGGVTINDANAGSTTKAATITAVSLTNYGNSAISSNALATLGLAGTGGTLGLTEGLTTPTNTTLAVNINGLTAGTVTDNSNTFKTLNFTTSGTASTVTFSDTAATALSVAGSSLLTLSGSAVANVTGITISGAAGFVDSDYAASALLTSVTDTSSGNVALSLNDAVAAFSGASATGSEIITITSDAMKAIAGDAIATSEIVFNAAAATFTAANSGANITGFKVLGVGSNSTGGTFNLGTAPFSQFTSIDDQGANGSITFTKVTAGSALSIDAANNGTVTYQTSDSSGASDSVAVTLGLTKAQAANLGLAATAGGFLATSSLILEDSGFIGIGTVSFTINNSTAGQAETITQLSDVQLAALTISGTGDLTVTNQFTDTAASLSITDNSTSTAGLTFAGGLLDNGLTGTLTLAGSNTAAMSIGSTNTTGLSDTGSSLTVTDSYAGNVTIPALLAANLTTETFTNTGTGTLTVGSGDPTDTKVATLNLSGNVSDFHGASFALDTVTTGITVNGATDNASVTFETAAASGAAAGKTDSITLGNGADVIVDSSAAGTVTVALGNGADTVSFTSVFTTGSASVSFGAHTGADAVSTLNDGTNAVLIANFTNLATISGLNNSATGSDTITFAGDLNTLVWAGTGATAASAQVTAAMVTADITHAGNTTALYDWIETAIDSAANHGIGGAAHDVAWFNFGGNTYLVESAAGATADAGTFATADTVVTLVGTYTFANNADVGAAGVFTLHG